MFVVLGVGLDLESVWLASFPRIANSILRKCAEVGTYREINGRRRLSSHKDLNAIKDMSIIAPIILP